MINSLKRYCFNKQYQKVKGIQKEDVSVGLIKSITILSQYPTYDFDDMEQSMAYFKSKQLACDGYLVVPDYIQSATEQIQQISQKECHWYDIPKQEVLINWLQHKTDLLMVVNPNNSRVIRYLSASSNSVLKTAISFDRHWEDNVSFCLEAENNKNSLFDYTKSLYQELLRIYNN